MLEHIRRIRELKKAEADARAREQDAPMNESRRHFLRGMAATAAVAAMPTVLKSESAIAGTLERTLNPKEFALEKKIAVLKQAVNAPDVLAALEGVGDRLVSRMLAPLKTGITRDEVRGTSRDMSDMRARHCVQFSYQRQANGGPNIVTLVSGGKKFRTMHEAGYGNGIFWGRSDRFLTAQHVLDKSQNHDDSMARRDVVVIPTGDSKARPELVVRDDTSLSNADLHGSFVSIEGIDPDATADSDGYKSYPGVAMQLHRGFVERVFKKAPPEYIERLSRSFVIALPAGEAQATRGQEMPATGMSGSPVFTIHNGNKVLAGVFHMAVSVPDPDTGQMVDIAFFHGIEDVREQFSAHARSGT